MIPSEHLRACPDHRLVHDREHACPGCTVGAIAKPDAVSDEHITDLHLRQQIESDTFERLMPLLEEEADRVDGEAYVAVAEMDAGDSGGAFIEEAAGYTAQERWFNVAVIEYGKTQRDVIKRDHKAREAIEKLEGGEPYVEVPEYEGDRLDGDEWAAIVAPRVYKYSYGRVDDDTLAILIGSPGESVYQKARRSLTHYGEQIDATVRTVEKREDWRGNVEALIEVTT